MPATRLLIISGVSGAGKTTAMHALEDLGFFCVDNLPPPLLPAFIDLITRPDAEMSQAALVMDAREGHFLQEAPGALAHLTDPRLDAKVLFLDCRDDILIRRFSETRRMHPLAPRTGVTEGIGLERDALAVFRDRADLIIDTSEMTVHELAGEIKTLFDNRPLEHELTLTLMSFGFRYGLPASADMVFDARFLPNPHFVPELKDFSGLDMPVVNFFEGKKDVREFENRLCDLLDYLLPRFLHEGKSYLTMAIGCTGGKHRSVYLTERVGERLAGRGFRMRIRHRELTRGFA